MRAQPYKGKKKGADSGIDGLIYFHDDNEAAKKIVVSVKGGSNIGVQMIRDLVGVLDREKADIGLFVTLAEPTGPMKTEAAAAGFYHSKGYKEDWPRIQILTIQGLLDGRERPAYKSVSSDLGFKKAKREITAHRGVVEMELD